MRSIISKEGGNKAYIRIAVYSSKHGPVYGVIWPIKYLPTAGLKISFFPGQGVGKTLTSTSFMSFLGSKSTDL